MITSHAVLLSSFGSPAQIICQGYAPGVVASVLDPLLTQGYGAANLLVCQGFSSCIAVSVVIKPLAGAPAT